MSQIKHQHTCTTTPIRGKNRPKKKNVDGRGNMTSSSYLYLEKTNYSDERDTKIIYFKLSNTKLQ